MVNCIFNKTTKAYLRGARWDIPPHKQATEILVKLDEFPDPRNDVWNGGMGVRAATSVQKKAYDAAHPEPVTLARLIDALKAKGVLTDANLKP